MSTLSPEQEKTSLQNISAVSKPFQGNRKCRNSSGLVRNCKKTGSNPVMQCHNKTKMEFRISFSKVIEKQMNKKNRKGKFYYPFPMFWETEIWILRWCYWWNLEYLPVLENCSDLFISIKLSVNLALKITGFKKLIGNYIVLYLMFVFTLRFFKAIAINLMSLWRHNVVSVPGLFSQICIPQL